LRHAAAGFRHRFADQSRQRLDTDPKQIELQIPIGEMHPLAKLAKDALQFAKQLLPIEFELFGKLCDQHHEITRGPALLIFARGAPPPVAAVFVL
jgi:hypothetical protein